MYLILSGGLLVSSLYPSIIEAISASIKKLSVGFYKNREGIFTFIPPIEIKKTILFEK